MIRACIAGVGGKMGSRILNALRSEEDFTISGAFEKPESPQIGLDAGLLSGAGPLEVTVSAGIEKALEKGADVVIDFTAPAASLHHARVCAERKVAFVVGTTGFSAQAKAELAGHGQKVPIVMAPNMSVGVNVLFRLVADAARALGKGYEVEIVEMHHRAKKDAPSGTALRLAEVAADALGLDPAAACVYERHGDTGPRKPGTIGVQTLRGGDVVGEHTVYFIADGERLELSHRATGRDNFARGAVRAARWVAGKPPGLYDMQDVLGFHS
ncbi:MAG TPA: 4-hydroxy-tetrahydrodipicolinate reductase [Myxococcales bacterium]|nr:4-hydroxy-tetrahydrodipicolinate reductase [Myxococcales bacterium]